jgi:hypothetical protein
VQPPDCVTNDYIARRQIIICTTSIISGNRMMEVAIEKGTLGKGGVLDVTP